MKIDKKLVALLATGVVAVSAVADSVVSSTSDAEARADGVGNDTKGWLYSGSYYATSPSIVSVFAFEVPTLAADESFSAASLTLDLKWVKGTPSFNCDVVGIGSRAADTVLASDYAAAGTMLHDDFYTSASATGVSTTSDFAGWLNDQTPGGFAIIKIDTGGYTGGAATTYQFASADDATGRTKPTLNYTTIPEPATLGLVGVFGGSLFFIRRRLKS